MKNIPIDVLRTFITIVELDSFTQAGSLLGRSQPAISLQIKRLESMFDQKLISKRGQSIELTVAGEKLLGYARRILAINDEAVANLTTTNVSGEIKLGIPSEFAATLLPRVLSQFVKTYPNINLSVTSDLSCNLVKSLPNQHFDIVMVLHDNPEEYQGELIKIDDLVWVGNERPVVDSESRLLLTFAPEGCIYRKRAIKVLTDAKRTWQINYTNPDLAGIKVAIEGGLGITALARSTVPDHLKIIRPKDGLPELGKIGIELVYPAKTSDITVTRLAEFLTSSLSA
ncbi:LysR family transcriptional regulator [Alteromonadaceae bacterium M269]|nr:LysR family transcriptional regulator [Alteromonadaceae bacterium M269]